MKQLPSTTLPGNQRGATLIVALILLVLISLIGVNSLKNASVAEKIASAGYQRNITFQSSESIAMKVMKEPALISKAMVDGPFDPPVNTNMDITEGELTVAPAGVGTLLGNSLNGSGISGQRIMVTSTSWLASDEKSATQTVHGLVRMVPNNL